MNDSETTLSDKEANSEDEDQVTEAENVQHQTPTASVNGAYESEMNGVHDEQVSDIVSNEPEDEGEGSENVAEANEDDAEGSIHEETFDQSENVDTEDQTIEIANDTNETDEGEDLLKEAEHVQNPRLESVHSLSVNVGSLQQDDSDTDDVCAHDGTNYESEETHTEDNEDDADDEESSKVEEEDHPDEINEPNEIEEAEEDTDQQVEHEGDDEGANSEDDETKAEMVEDADEDADQQGM